MTTTPAPPDTDHADDLPPATGAGRMLLGSALMSPPEVVTDVAALVAPGDLNTTSQARIWGAITDRAQAGLTGPEIVLDQLTRTGHATPPVLAELAHAVTAGAYPEAIRAYAAPVVADAFRRGVESYGAALVDAHATSPEDELWGFVCEGGKRLRRIVERLTAARGGDL